MPERHPASADVHNLYLEGRHSMQRDAGAALSRAKECFESAIRLDRDYAPLYSSISDYYCLQAILGLRPARESMPKAEWAARRALELDHSLEESHSTLGTVLGLFHRRWDDAHSHFRWAIEMKPTAFTRFQFALWGLAPLGRFAEAEVEARRAVELEPQSSRFLSGLAWIMYAQRDYRSCLLKAKAALELDSSSAFANLSAILACVAMGWSQDAMAVCRHAMDVGANDVWMKAAQAVAAAAQENHAEALSVCDDFLRCSVSGFVQPAMMGLASAAAGNKEDAVRHFQAAEEQCDPAVYLALATPLVDQFRTQRPAAS